MDYYFVNKEARENGDHEIHRGVCNRVTDDRNRIYLGFFASCQDALIKAQRFYDQLNGCRLCCGECHSIPSQQIERPNVGRNK